VHATGEVVAWTASYGIVSRVAPPGFTSLTMGAWYLVTLGLGGYLSGFAGNLLDSFGFAATFAALAALMLTASITALLLRKPLLQLAVRAEVRL
jgi:dipeptide/tripeptide permease